jgi:hypothetical protein
MANIGAYGSKQMLDWVLGGAAATAPASRLAALTYGTPFSTAALGQGSEHSSNLGYIRQTALFSAAASPAGSASNTAAMTFGPFSSSNAIQGLVITDTISIFSGNIWWFGTLLTARTVLPGDTLVVNAGSLLITLG